MFCHLLTNQILLVVMENKVPTPLLWLFWIFFEGIRLNYLLLYTILI